MPRLTPLQRLAHAGLAAALTLGLAPSLAFAEEPGEQSDAANRLIEQFAQQSNQKSRYAFSGLADTSAYNYDPSMPVAYIEDILPKEFYMKDRGWTTPVKNQAPWGTCWAFASIAAAEASITSGLMAAGKAPSEPVDLSELHTAWFSCMPVADKDNPQYNEGIHIASNDESPTGISAAVLDRGGFMYTSASVFSNGVGPVYEKDVPYKNKSGETVKTTDGRDLYYERGDWFVDEEQHFGSAYELKESLVLPSPATFIDANKELVGNPFDVYGNLREDVSYKHDYDADAAIKKEPMGRSRRNHSIPCRYITT